MARTPLLDHVQRAVAEVADSEGGLTRAQLLRRAGFAGIGLTALGRMAPSARGATPAKVVVVGAGLAGLTCAYRLRQAGYFAEVHEASDRIGGRCWTGRGDFAEGQIYEHGGELIDQGHNEIRSLAQELGLSLDNLHRAEVNGTELLAHFDGVPYTEEEITDDIKEAWQKIHSDVSAASYPTLFDSFTQRGLSSTISPSSTGSRSRSPAGSSPVSDSCSTSPTSSSTARSRTSRAPSTCSTCSATRGRASSGCSAPRTRSTTFAAGTTRSRIGSRRSSPARSRPAPSSSP